MIEAVTRYLKQLQQQLCRTLEEVDTGQQFIHDDWTRESGGYGSSRVLSDGNIFEQAGVNFSVVEGKALPASATERRPELSGCTFKAMGVSVVIHPKNPYIPTTHMNVRFFIAQRPGMQPIWWFGGGYDLTPYYGFEQDCIDWHQAAKQVCDKYDAALYPEFKAWADRYFYIKHRQEHRGIGGIFFDDFNLFDFDKSFNFMRDVGDSFLPAYVTIVKKRVATPYSEHQRDFQCYRRGRYVEFNLIYDRGTSFGLQSGGRTESILMSLPPKVNWRYNWSAEPGSDESLLYTDFLPAKDWL